VLLVGHSLGGGVAKIVGARLGLTVFAVGAPGITLAHKIFGISSQHVGRGEINLINTGDIVPLIDSIQGLIFQVGWLVTGLISLTIY